MGNTSGFNRYACYDNNDRCDFFVVLTMFLGWLADSIRARKLQPSDKYPPPEFDAKPAMNECKISPPMKRKHDEPSHDDELGGMLGKNLKQTLEHLASIQPPLRDVSVRCRIDNNYTIQGLCSPKSSTSIAY